MPVCRSRIALLPRFLFWAWTSGSSGGRGRFCLLAASPVLVAQSRCVSSNGAESCGVASAPAVDPMLASGAGSSRRRRTGPGPQKLAVVLRKDLKMSAGKAAAQVGHAVLAAANDVSPERRRMWVNDGERIIVLQAGTDADIDDLRSAAQKARVRVNVVVDAGLTEVDVDSLTALAVGPDDASRVDLVTGSLALFRSHAEDELEQLRQRVIETGA
eukprot:TRINITY_DN55597_c0_g1_i1.p1 TRINITY_DN55597_c0_g1~~TRINITY_DN55597_c0_g1_i1.p1  ORF type:complete len:215 (-),score=40.23 TRINITY_DN55597_c0_g1_i1:287-931(-)